MDNLQTWHTNRSFPLECGQTLHHLEIGYHTFGRPNADQSNVVWICHALTANSDPSEWWPGLVGPGLVINPEEHYIICANILGSCYGTTSPLSTNPETGAPYCSAFPLITVRDMVRAHQLLAEHLGIQKIKLLMGGSLGGQQALEWSIMQPDLMDNLLLVATNAFHSPFGIAFNESQRLSIFADASYFENRPNGGQAGLKAARSIALISYRSYYAYTHSQQETDIDKLGDYKAASYQRYQGDKLVNRFNAYSYVSLINTMDSHQVGRGRGGVENALKMVKAKTLCIGIGSDLLFPPSEQEYMHGHIPNSKFEWIESFFGHDGFLLEVKQLTGLILKHEMLF